MLQGVILIYEWETQWVGSDTADFFFLGGTKN